jgi:hypothetical protein
MSQGYAIELRFLDGLTSGQQALFETAASRWRAVIENNQPPLQVLTDIIAGLLIEARGVEIDGAGTIAGHGQPTVFRPQSLIPAKGRLEFDLTDLEWLEREGLLVDAVAHEIGHVLGIGTLWTRLNLLVGSGSPNPGFIGVRARREFAALLGHEAVPQVPVENSGGLGTIGTHWREQIFGNEMMTGFITAQENPLSRVTLGCLQDLGYSVFMEAADAYVLPSALELAMMGVHAQKPHRHQCSLCHASREDFRASGKGSKRRKSASRNRG